MTKKANQGQRPGTPAEWRELLKNGYEYPEEIEALGKRRVRRRVRKAYRQEQREEARRHLAEERRREPVTPGGAIVVIVGILALGAAVSHWWPDRGGAPATVVRAGSGDRTEEPGAAGTPSAPPTPSAPASPAPVADLSTPERTAEGWARAYLTRNPPVDKKHSASVGRAAPWMTESLTENLTRFEDQAWGRLVSNGGVSTVKRVSVAASDDERTRLQADTPARVWRKVTVEVDVAGYTKYSENTVLQAEIVRSGGSWRVSKVLGV
ncbi:hypothetical protein [Streptomyces albireticuli]|uniref:Uncharacterized protein n=1 Tax=Streptomyces albireticuli TaxID=1940 RepID=A0A2A2D6R7_9ACTN|nr:hypothetical protein [Streptomyces albireticuli]MCD9143896.1 hypothetical protein [Streptomyces albireticuli]MCD9161673.1 hypothetical protein [Streptomyces albireticuli]MCD9192013.1 hypothetical protein [Streptomyces albireticuli]PAU47012.1 hypothetical protein CK936_21015 [Streptomyces albireticuli]